MKLENTRENLDTFSSKASEICRQLALAALAVIWIFKVDQQGGKVSVPADLYWPAILAIAALTFDLMQYVYGSIAWSFFNRRMEIEHDLNEEVEFDAPRWINWPTNIFYYVKLVLVGLCYVLLLIYLFSVAI